MTIHAQWFGGPWDGKEYALPDGTYEIHVPVPVEVWKWLDESAPGAELSYQQQTCVLHRNEQGHYFIMWREPK